METSMQRLQSLVELKKLRRTLEVLALVSLSVVSVLFSDLSWLPGSVASIDIFPVSSFVSGFLQYYMNKKVVFLLCNGILVIVSGYPFFVASPYNNTPHDVPSETHFQEPKASASQRETAEETAWAVVNFVPGEELQTVEEEECCKELQVIAEQTHFQEPKASASQRETAEESAWAVVNFVPGEELQTVEEEECCKELQVIAEQKREDGDENDEEDEGVLYSGESDAIFEDFIRRTKEGMRSEARRLLIVM